jgi:hypothetical protein
LWDAEVKVEGVGNGTSSATDNYIQILTNMDLSLSYNSFSAVALNNTANGTAALSADTPEVTVTYVFKLYSDWSTGATIDPTGTTTGSLLSSKTVTVDNTAAASTVTDSLPLTSTSDGVAGLDIHRTVQVTGQLPGDNQYISTGAVTVSIN